MPVKKTVTKSNKEDPKKIVIKKAAASKKEDVEKIAEIKVIEKKNLSHARVQTAEGWKRMMKRQHAKKS